MTVISLQGGNEFCPDCAPMDAALVARAGGGPVAIVPLAARPGREYDTAGRNGVNHFGAIDAVDPFVSPDPRHDPEGALAAVRRARLVVLPGGSPTRLLNALRETGFDAALARHVTKGGALMGASAGAMVLCEWTMLPDHPEGPRAVAGLGLVRDLAVVPHYDGDRGDWSAALRSAAPGLDLLGLPECSGVLVDGARLVAVGARPPVLSTMEGDLELALDVVPDDE